MTIVRLGADVVGSSPAARQFFFIYIYIYIYIYIEKMLELHQREWKKCLNSDSNRDPPAYAADCSAVELLRPRSDSRVRGHLNHLASASGPPHRRDLGKLEDLSSSPS